MKSLVIAEKPSVARDIARVLHCTQKGNGILEGKDYVVMCKIFKVLYGRSESFYKLF